MLEMLAQCCWVVSIVGICAVGQKTYVNILPGTALHTGQFLHGHDFAGCDYTSISIIASDTAWSISILTVSSMNLGIDLNASILRDHLIWNRHAFVNRDTLAHDGVVLHI